MKHLFLLLMVLCCSRLSAQYAAPLAIEDKKMDAYLTGRKPATITIQLKNLPDSVKKVDIKYTLVQFGAAFQVSKYAETDAAGKATIVLHQNLPYQQVWISAGDYLYAGVYVNSGLNIAIDVSKMPKDGGYMIGDGIEYTGDDGELTAVMNKKVLFKKKERESLESSFSDICIARKKYTEASFMFKIDSIRKKIIQMENAFIADNPKYSWAVRNETMSDIYRMLCLAYWNERMPDKLFNEINEHKPIFVSNDGTFYYRYLNTYVNNKKIYPKTATLAGTLSVLDSLYNPQKADLLKLQLLEAQKDKAATAYPLIINSLATQWSKRVVEGELASVNQNQKRIDSLLSLSKKIENANIGTPLMQLPFEANLYQVDALKSVDDFIVNLKLKFPNKALVIDFWATWCVPCVSDMPFSKALHEKNKDLPIEYIYLCTSNNSNVELWKTRIADMQLPGTHIFINEKIIADLKAAFNASSGFPAYVVVDMQGKVKPSAITRMGSLDVNTLKAAVGL